MSQPSWSWTSRKELPSRRGAHIPLLEEILRELETPRLGSLRFATISASRWPSKNRFPTRFDTAINWTNRSACTLNAKSAPNDSGSANGRGPGFKLQFRARCTADEKLECQGAAAWRSSRLT